MNAPCTATLFCVTVPVMVPEVTRARLDILARDARGGDAHRLAPKFAVPRRVGGELVGSVGVDIEGEGPVGGGRSEEFAIEAAAAQFLRLDECVIDRIAVLIKDRARDRDAPLVEDEFQVHGASLEASIGNERTTGAVYIRSEVIVRIAYIGFHEDRNGRRGRHPGTHRLHGVRAAPGLKDEGAVALGHRHGITPCDAIFAGRAMMKALLMADPDPSITLPLIWKLADCNENATAALPEIGTRTSFGVGIAKFTEVTVRPICVGSLGISGPTPTLQVPAAAGRKCRRRRRCRADFSRYCPHPVRSC